MGVQDETEQRFESRIAHPGTHVLQITQLQWQLYLSMAHCSLVTVTCLHNFLTFISEYQVLYLLSTSYKLDGIFILAVTFNVLSFRSA